MTDIQWNLLYSDGISYQDLVSEILKIVNNAYCDDPKDSLLDFLEIAPGPIRIASGRVSLEVAVFTTVEKSTRDFYEWGIELLQAESMPVACPL